MTITKHTPVVVSDTARLRVERAIAKGTIHLGRTDPPAWMHDWLDLDAYRAAETKRRRVLAGEAFEREYLHGTGQEPPNVPQSDATAPDVPTPHHTPERIADACTRVRPGLAYIGCAAGCGSLVRRHRASIAYCPDCPRPKREQRRAVADDTPINPLLIPV